MQCSTVNPSAATSSIRASLSTVAHAMSKLVTLLPFFTRRTTEQRSSQSGCSEVGATSSNDHLSASPRLCTRRPRRLHLPSPPAAASSVIVRGTGALCTCTEHVSIFECLSRPRARCSCSCCSDAASCALVAPVQASMLARIASVAAGAVGGASAGAFLPAKSSFA